MFYYTYISYDDYTILIHSFNCPAIKQVFLFFSPLSLAPPYHHHHHHHLLLIIDIILSLLNIITLLIRSLRFVVLAERRPSRF